MTSPTPTVPATPSESADGIPILVGLTATDIHTPPAYSPDDVILSFINSGVTDVAVTISFGLVNMVQNVPAQGNLSLPPWTIRNGTVTAAADTEDVLHAIVSIRR